MPFENEHAARQKSPGQYHTIRRQNNAFGRGIHAIYGIKGKGDDRKSEVQSLRFDRKLWTIARAKAWLKKHGYSTRIEKATG